MQTPYITLDKTQLNQETPGQASGSRLALYDMTLDTSLKLLGLGFVTHTWFRDKAQVLHIF